MIRQFRVTKYDPANRNATGAYIPNTWTSISDIGRSFDGIVLTQSEYQRVEDLYVEIAVSFLSESGAASLQIIGLESSDRHLEPGIALANGTQLSEENLAPVIRLALREQIWCRLEEEGGSFIHFGYDYYMYLGVIGDCPSSRRLATEQGLFVEEYHSPYQEGGSAYSA